MDKIPVDWNQELPGIHHEGGHGDVRGDSDIGWGGLERMRKELSLANYCFAGSFSYLIGYGVCRVFDNCELFHLVHCTDFAHLERVSEIPLQFLASVLPHTSGSCRSC